LIRTRKIGMHPLPTSSTVEARELPEVLPAMRWWVRGTLLGVAGGLVVVFVIAWRLDPYNADGSARSMATHRQLGLPPCTFYVGTGLPCPSCGMTTSFALLVRGDVVNSMRANLAGTLLAICGMLFIPWSLASVLRRRTLFFRSMERTLTVFVLGLLGLMLLRWVIVVGLAYWRGTPLPG
jgi:hypothetical protein